MSNLPGSTPECVVVTGGGGGIGRFVCRFLAEKGYRVIAVNRHFNEPFLGEVGGLDVTPMAVDFANPGAVKAFADGLTGEDTDIVGAILLASPAPTIGLLSTLAPATLVDHLSVSVVGHHQLIATLIERHWKQRAQGTVLAVLTAALSDNAMAPANANMGGYIVAKAALRTLLQCYQKDFPWLQIALISPGFTQTDMLAAFDDRYIELLERQGQIDDPSAVAAKIVTEFSTGLNQKS